MDTAFTNKHQCSRKLLQFAIGGNISGFNSHTLGNGDGYNTCWVAGAVVGGNGDGGVLS